MKIYETQNIRNVVFRTWRSRKTTFAEAVALLQRLFPEWDA